MHQVSKPRAANHSMTDESGRPGTCRSKVGCDAIEEPCTKRTVPFGVAPDGGDFCQRKSLTSPLRVQCSVPAMRVRSSMVAVLYLYFMQESPAFRRRRLHGDRNARHVPQAADAPRAGARCAA